MAMLMRADAYGRRGSHGPIMLVIMIMIRLCDVTHTGGDPGRCARAAGEGSKNFPSKAASRRILGYGLMHGACHAIALLSLSRVGALCSRRNFYFLRGREHVMSGVQSVSRGGRRRKERLKLLTTGNELEGHLGWKISPMW